MDNKRPLLITLAGLPSVGKSTVAQYMARMMENAVLLQRETSSPLEAPLWSLEAFLKYQQRWIARWLWIYRKQIKYKWKARIIVCDRGIEDAMCFTEYVVSSFFRDKVIDFTYLWENELSSDVVLYLNARRDVIEQRRVARRKKEFGRGLSKLGNYWTYYESWFKAKEETILVDSSDMTVAQTVKYIAMLLKEKLGE